MITSGNTVKTVKYAGPLYELHLRPHGNTADDQVHYIRAGATVAIYTRIVKKKSVTEKTRYLHKDHLGSIVALSDEAGAIAERLSFDPHGQRRETTWPKHPGEAAVGPIVPLETPRGYGTPRPGSSQFALTTPFCGASWSASRYTRSKGGFEIELSG